MESLDLPVYVWTANGKIQELMTQRYIEQKPSSESSGPIESFDNLRRTTSTRGTFIEIPTNNLIKTRLLIDPQPLFRFTVLSNRTYRLIISIRAKTTYRYKLPVFARYYIRAMHPDTITDYVATYLSSNATSMETEKRSYTMGTNMNVIVDNQLSIVKLEVSFRCVKNGTTVTVHHGLQTDDPEAEVYCMAGSTASLMEM
jgi:hypothetical protein